MINPPRREALLQIEQAGGGERALNWLLDGMVGRKLTDSTSSQSVESIRKLLESRGFDASTIEAMISAMPPDMRAASASPALGAEIRLDAERQARQIALATCESRITVADMLSRAESGKKRELYKISYAAALARAGFERVELIDRFPVLTAQYGYTRGPSAPGQSRLRTYRDQNGEYTVYGELAQTEALLIRLSPIQIHKYLAMRGFNLPPTAADERSAAEVILAAMGPTDTPNDVTSLVTEVVHSVSHAFIKRAAVYAGIERNALCELVLPATFSFFVYAAARGDFVLGGLQALFESELHHLLNGLVDDEHRCALDPGCEDSGGACAVCLHLGEPSCRMFNTCLSRKALAGGSGYFDVTGG